MSKVKVTPELLADLRKKAEAATPGPWKWKKGETSVEHGSPDNDRSVVSFYELEYNENGQEAFEEAEGNAAHIAAANPAVVLALVQEIERLRAVEGELTAAYMVGYQDGKDVHRALLAAAPDLLAALEKAVADYGNPGGPWNVPSEPGAWIEMARNAIEKARDE
jgi:hypothetical protein